MFNQARPEVRVYSRAAMEAARGCSVPHAIISITTFAVERARLPENELTLGVLRLSFADRVVELEDSFTDAMADAIVRFVQRPPASLARVWCVHCDAGRSRSPGVAAGMLRGLFDAEDAAMFREFVPNQLVYRKVLAAAQHPERALEAIFDRACSPDAPTEPRVDVGHPFSAAEVAVLERLVCSPMPRAYRHFLRRYGSARHVGATFLPFERLVEETETLQSMDEHGNSSHRALVFAEDAAFDFRVRNVLGEPAIVELPGGAGVFAAEPAEPTEDFLHWLRRRLGL